MVSVAPRREEIFIMQLALMPMRKMKMKMKKRWCESHYGGKFSWHWWSLGISYSVISHHVSCIVTCKSRVEERSCGRNTLMKKSVKEGLLGRISLCRCSSTSKYNSRMVNLNSASRHSLKILIHYDNINIHYHNFVLFPQIPNLPQSQGQLLLQKSKAKID